MTTPSLPTRVNGVCSVCMGSNSKSAVAQVAKEVGEVVHSLSGLILMPD